MKINHNYFLNLAFNLAKINLGKTKENPSVGCVVVKNKSVISSSCTSMNGRPHAEYVALNKDISFNKSYLYVTMEPCTHYGLTPPCANIIKKKGIKKVFYAFDDVDKRTAKKSKRYFTKNKIKIYKKKITKFKNFYKSYIKNKVEDLPYIDAKIAISKDYFSINKKYKWITNSLSRSRAHLIRSEYDSIISTSKSINKDNSLLNCRINGYDNRKPDLIIIDLNLRIRKNLRLFKLPKNRKILIITTIKNSKKIIFLRKKGIKFIIINTLKEKNDFIFLFKVLKKKGYNRILIEAGLNFLNELLTNKLVSNLFIFKSLKKLGKNGKNNCSINYIKKLKLSKKINVNLDGDQLYKVIIK